jgi:hypothetical protein
MLGWKLFLRAATLIVDNVAAAIRLSALPYGIVAALGLWIAATWPEFIGTGMAGFDPDTPPPSDFAGATVLSLLATLLASMWIAVAWHRYILLAEGGERWVAPFDLQLVLGYLGRSILLGLAVGVVMLALATAVGVLLLPLFGLAAQPLVGAVALFTAMILFYRLGVILPAGAIGRRMTFADAWRSTEGHSGTAIVLSLVTVGFTLLLQVPTMIDGTSGMITAIYQIVVQWIGLILGVGTLTALYGVVVEGRPVE